MADTTMDAKKTFTYLLVFGVPLLLLRIFNKPSGKKVFSSKESSAEESDPVEREILSAPDLAEEDAMANPMAGDAYVALTAYITAYNAKEPQNKLDELNDELANEMGLRIYRRRSDNNLVVRDLNGNDILVHNG